MYLRVWFTPAFIIATPPATFVSTSPAAVKSHL
jgi:hypothetical protein